MQPNSIESLITPLVADGVEFVVVGGMAGVLHGAPVVTKDLDIVHRRTPENVAKLLRILRSIDARLRADARRIEPTESMPSGRGHVLLDTESGPFDVLCELGVGEDYDWLAMSAASNTAPPACRAHLPAIASKSWSRPLATPSSPAYVTADPPFAACASRLPMSSNSSRAE